VVLTAGDSHLIVLSDNEIEELTRKTIEYVDGRAMVVAAAALLAAVAPAPRT